jgi:acetyl esterase/lipase
LTRAVLYVAGAALALLGAFGSAPVPLLTGLFCLAGAWIERRLRARGVASALQLLPLRLLAFSCALVVAGIAYVWLRSGPPVPDAFYDAPLEIPSQPGTLLRQEPFTRTVPAGARAWRILYSTTRADGIPAVASAVVLAPLELPPGPRPLVAWTHGTTGVVPGCAPSLLPDPYPFGQIPAVERAVENGWVLVATDYAGLGTKGPHPYLIGEGEARSALDSVRAARALPELSLDDRVMVWGHSQGGHAALWTGAIAARYSPDVAVVGVAALAPATEIALLVDSGKRELIGRILSAFVTRAYSETYPDVRLDDYVRPGARVPAGVMSDACLGPGGLFSVLTAAAMTGDVFLRPPVEGPLRERLEENTPRGSVPAPLLIAQGSTDALVLPDVQEKFVLTRCGAGQSLEYRTYANRDHMALVAPDSPLIEDLVRWTKERLEGVPTEPGCRTIPR